MVCEINYEKKETSLSEFIKNLCEFENIDVLFECVELLKEEMSIDEIKNLNDEKILEYFIRAENNVKKV